MTKVFPPDDLFSVFFLKGICLRAQDLEQILTFTLNPIQS